MVFWFSGCKVKWLYLSIGTFECHTSRSGRDRIAANGAVCLERPQSLEIIGTEKKELSRATISQIISILAHWKKTGTIIIAVCVSNWDFARFPVREWPDNQVIRYFFVLIWLGTESANSRLVFRLRNLSVICCDSQPSTQRIKPGHSDDARSGPELCRGGKDQKFISRSHVSDL